VKVCAIALSIMVDNNKLVLEYLLLDHEMSDRQIDSFGQITERFELAIAPNDSRHILWAMVFNLKARSRPCCNQWFILD
jgi:hypothetical protein